MIDFDCVVVRLSGLACLALLHFEFLQIRVSSFLYVFTDDMCNSSSPIISTVEAFLYLDEFGTEKLRSVI